MLRFGKITAGKSRPVLCCVTADVTELLQEACMCVYTDYVPDAAAALSLQNLQVTEILFFFLFFNFWFIFDMKHNAKVFTCIS